MGERRHVGSRAGGRLGRRLRRETARTRPAFSPTLHQRIVAAAVREHAFAARPRAPWPGRASAVAATLACMACVAWLPGRGPRPAAPSPAAVAAEPALDELPSLDEIGEHLTRGTAALAAEAVGLPRWNDLVDAGSFVMDPRDLIP